MYVAEMSKTRFWFLQHSSFSTVKLTVILK